MTAHPLLLIEAANDNPCMPCCFHAQSLQFGETAVSERGRDISSSCKLEICAAVYGLCDVTDKLSEELNSTI